MQDFIGVNLLEGDPIQYANCAGFAREYHEWPYDEGNHLDVQKVPMAPVPQRYPNNRYAWNTSRWQSDKQFDNWYVDLRNRLDRSANSPLPICATLKSCLPFITFDKTGSTSWSVGGLSEVKPNEGILANSVLPESYRWYADWVYQFTKKHGSSNTNIGTFKAALGEPNTTADIGRNAVGYIELWNEENKYWKTPFSLYQFTGEEYGAMTSAAFYGKNKNGTDLNADAGSALPLPSTQSYKLGMRNADPNMRLVLGGTAGIRDFDANFITSIKTWYTNNPSVGAFPYD